MPLGVAEANAAAVLTSGFPPLHTSTVYDTNAFNGSNGLNDFNGLNGFNDLNDFNVLNVFFF